MHRLPVGSPASFERVGEEIYRARFKMKAVLTAQHASSLTKVPANAVLQDRFRSDLERLRRIHEEAADRSFDAAVTRGTAAPDLNEQRLSAPVCVHSNRLARDEPVQPATQITGWR